MADNTGLFGDGMMGGYGNNITAANIIRSRYKQPIAQAAMENVDPYQQFLRRPENSVLPDWMSNSSSNSVMGKLDTNDPYGIEQARNANPTANEEAGLEMPMLADPYNYVGLGLGTGAANAMRKFVAPKANQMLEDYMVKSGMQLPATVWHGSSHKFDKFDASKLGTSEGSQAYAHGHYTAVNPNNAQGYIPTYEGAPEGQLYKIDLPDEHIAKMLDWDTPLSEQAWFKGSPSYDEILATVKREGRHPTPQEKLIAKIKSPYTNLSENMTGENLYSNLGSNIVESAKNAREYGIPGVTYIARGAGAGSKNYVVFPGNEDMLNILERNGQKLKD